MNEACSIFSHFARIYDEGAADSMISKDLSKTESYLKRAILDCYYKYNCISLYDFYDRFRKEYRFEDLSVIENREFLRQITQNFTEGQNFFLKQKNGAQQQACRRFAL